MHEYSIVRALLDRVEAEAGARGATAVRRIHLRVGELSGVETDLLRSAYELFREASPVAGAELEIEPVAARWVCPACDRAIVRGAALSCPECSRPARLAAGDEIVLQRLELEVA